VALAPSGSAREAAAGSSWASSPAARRVMRGNRKRDTRPELALRHAVRQIGLRYRLGRHPIVGRIGTADLVFPAARVAVFLDGCFWHGCPEHFVQPHTNPGYWGPKIERNRQRDEEVDAILAAAGWATVRVWEHENPEAAARRVGDVVRGRPSPPNQRASGDNCL
jgi:DNA mismatch endonuclease, patch repair protein